MRKGATETHLLLPKESNVPSNCKIAVRLFRADRLLIPDPTLRERRHRRRHRSQAKILRLYSMPVWKP